MTIQYYSQVVDREGVVTEELAEIRAGESPSTLHVQNTDDARDVFNHEK